jgi:hypothetical protein
MVELERVARKDLIGVKFQCFRMALMKLHSQIPCFASVTVIALVRGE